MSSARFRTDMPDQEHFVGRVREIEELVAAMTEGVDSIAAVMGGGRVHCCATWRKS
jgi:hypothetical protein